MDNSAVAEALIGIVTSLNKDIAEVYVKIPGQVYENIPFNVLMDLFVDSIEYRHQGTIGAHVPGLTSPEVKFRPNVQAELAALDDSVNLGVGTLSEFTGFALVGTADSLTEFNLIKQSFQNLIVNSVPGIGRLDVPQPRIYNWGRLITPFSVPSGQLFTPIWELLKVSDSLAAFATGAQSAFKKLQELGILLQNKADNLRAIVKKIDELLDLVTGFVPPAGTLSAITFSKLSLDELRNCLKNSEDEPAGLNSLGAIFIVSDPGVVDLFEAIS